MQSNNQGTGRASLAAGSDTAVPQTVVPHTVVGVDRFTPVEELARWHEDLDRRGLRATGSPEQEAYIDDLARRLGALGLDVVAESFPVRRWTARRWALSLAGGGGTAGEGVHVGSYVPFSGQTGPDGVSGPLTSAPAAGGVGLVDVEVLPLKEGDFASLDWDAPDLPVVPPDRNLAAPYERVWLSQDGMRAQLDAHAAAGAAGLVFVVDGLACEVDGSYLLYDGILRGIPALVVDRSSGERLREHALAGGEVTLVLEADVDDVESRNLHVVVPGATDELVMVQSHTDGTNALEDNGPEAIVAMAEYLVGVPTAELPRGTLLVLSSGHFATRTAWGTAEFLRRHRDDLVARTVAALSIEHLGALAARATPTGYEASGGHELGCFFASPHRAVIDVVRRALDRAAVTDSLVLRPFTQDETGESPDGLGWPGDGTVLWAVAHLPSANFITGPGYLLAPDPTTHLIDVAAMRRQSIAFLEAALELGTVPRADLLLAPDGVGG